MTEPIDTRALSAWRQLKFASVDECISEVQQIMHALEQGKLATTGNWSAGQIMAHIASWIEYAYGGFPMHRPPFFIRWILRLRLRKMLHNGMPRGVRIPGAKEGTYGMDEMSSQEAGQRLLTALERLASSEPAKFDSPAFGKMSHEDRIKLNLRHAELHLGFLTY